MAPPNPMWLRWRKDLSTITNEMRLAASEVHGTVTADLLYWAANHIEQGTYYLGKALLIDQPEPPEEDQDHG